MGKDADTIYTEIAAHRRHLTERVNHLERRVEGDIETVKERTIHRPSALVDRASEHPLAAIAAGLGVGVLAGILAPSGRGARHDDRRNGRSRRDHDEDDDGGGGLAGMLAGGMVSRKIAGLANDAVQPLIDDVMAGLRGDERRPEERDAERERERAD